MIISAISATTTLFLHTASYFGKCYCHFQDRLNKKCGSSLARKSVGKGEQKRRGEGESPFYAALLVPQIEMSAHW